MRKCIPIIVGLSSGVAVGVFFVFRPVESLALYVPYEDLEPLANALRRVFLPNSEPMAALYFTFPLVVLYFAVIGSIGGCVVSFVLWLLRRVRRLHAG